MANKPEITIEHIYERCTHQIFARGKAYYENGAIRNMEWDGEKITGRCLGTRTKPYRVEAKLDDRQGVVWATCTCPYEYGGDCKHIVALLLTYLYHPKRFADKKDTVVQSPSQSPLMSRQKTELIIIIQQMLARYPDLQEIVDNPFPKHIPAGFDVTPFRGELRNAFRRYWNNYDEERAARKIDDIRQHGDKLLRAQNWESATLIYGVILEEFGTSEYILTHFEPIGFFKRAINEVLESVVVCFSYLKPSPSRSALLKGMIALWTWQCRYGYNEIGADVQMLLYDTIQLEDAPEIRAYIQERYDYHKKHQPYAFHDWQQKKYDNFFRILDFITRQDEEAFIQELYAQGFLTVYIRRLLLGGQIEKATQILDEKALTGEALTNCLRIFDFMGYRSTALRLAQDSIKRGLNEHVIRWAVASSRLNEQEDIGTLLLWLTYQFRYSRQMQDYHAIKRTVKPADLWWDKVYPQIIADLQESGDDELLFEVYLNDKKWNPAWQLLPKLMVTPESRWDLKLAQASREEYPERAIPVYLRYAHWHIRQRNRENYAIAASMLATVQVLYESQDDYELWEREIRHIRTEYKSLRALHEELKRVGLD